MVANEWAGAVDANKAFLWLPLLLGPVDLEEDCIWIGVILSSIGGDIEVMRWQCRLVFCV
jgi:hypothetical protein